MPVNINEIATSVIQLRGKDLYAVAKVPVYYFPGQDQQAWSEVLPGGFIGKIDSYFIERPAMKLWWKFKPGGFARQEYFVQHDPAAFDLERLKKQGVSFVNV